MSEQQPTGQEVVCLFIANRLNRFKRLRQKRETGRRPTAPYLISMSTPPEDVEITLTSYDISTRCSLFAHNKYGKNLMGGTIARRWRELKSPLDERLRKIGVSVEGRSPEADETFSHANKVWDVTADVETYREGVMTVAPYTDFPF